MRKRGPPKSGPSPAPIITLTPEEELELDYYICCCIEEIENILSKNCSEKQKKLGEISLKILRNPAETFIKKKQVMRQWFDDYKTKFDSKKKQTMVNLNEKKCVIKKPQLPSKSVFYRKHEVNMKPVLSDSENINLESEDRNPFKFDF